MTTRIDVHSSPVTPLAARRGNDLRRASEIRVNDLVAPLLAPRSPAGQLPVLALQEGLAAGDLRSARRGRPGAPGETDAERDLAGDDELSWIGSADRAMKAVFDLSTPEGGHGLPTIELAQAAGVATDAAGSAGASSATGAAVGGSSAGFMGAVSLPMLGVGLAVVGVAAAGGGGGGGGGSAPPAPVVNGQTFTLVEVPGTFEVLLNPARLDWTGADAPAFERFIIRSKPGAQLTASDGDDLIFADQYALHAAQVDGGAGTDTLVINATAPFAQPTSIRNVEILNITNSPNVYGPGRNAWLQLDESAISLTDSSIDLFYATGVQSLVISEGSLPNGGLYVWNIRNGADAMLSLGFEHTVRLQYNDSLDKTPLDQLDITLRNVTFGDGAVLDVVHNAGVLNLTSAGTLNIIDTAALGKYLRVLKISGGGGLIIATPLTFYSETPVVIDASSATGSTAIRIDLQTNRKSAVTLTGGTANDEFELRNVAAAVENLLLTASLGAGSAQQITFNTGRALPYNIMLHRSSVISGDNVKLTITDGHFDISEAAGFFGAGSFDIFVRQAGRLSLSAAQVSQSRSVTGLGNVDIVSIVADSGATATYDLTRIALDFNYGIVQFTDRVGSATGEIQILGARDAVRMTAQQIFDLVTGITGPGTVELASRVSNSISPGDPAPHLGTVYDFSRFVSSQLRVQDKTLTVEGALDRVWLNKGVANGLSVHGAGYLMLHGDQVNGLAINGSGKVLISTELLLSTSTIDQLQRADLTGITATGGIAFDMAGVNVVAGASMKIGAVPLTILDSQATGPGAVGGTLDLSLASRMNAPQIVFLTPIPDVEPGLATVRLSAAQLDNLPITGQGNVTVASGTISPWLANGDLDLTRIELGGGGKMTFDMAILPAGGTVTIKASQVQSLANGAQGLLGQNATAADARGTLVITGLSGSYNYFDIGRADVHVRMELVGDMELRSGSDLSTGRTITFSGAYDVDLAVSAAIGNPGGRYQLEDGAGLTLTSMQADRAWITSVGASNPGLVSVVMSSVLGGSAHDLSRISVPLRLVLRADAALGAGASLNGLVTSVGSERGPWRLSILSNVGEATLDVLAGTTLRLDEGVYNGTAGINQRITVGANAGTLEIVGLNAAEVVDGSAGRDIFLFNVSATFSGELHGRDGFNTVRVDDGVDATAVTADLRTARLINIDTFEVAAGDIVVLSAAQANGARASGAGRVQIGVSDSFGSDLRNVDLSNISADIHLALASNAYYTGFFNAATEAVLVSGAAVLDVSQAANLPASFVVAAGATLKLTAAQANGHEINGVNALAVTDPFYGATRSGAVTVTGPVAGSIDLRNIDVAAGQFYEAQFGSAGARIMLDADQVPRFGAWDQVTAPIASPTWGVLQIDGVRGLVASGTGTDLSLLGSRNVSLILDGNAQLAAGWDLGNASTLVTVEGSGYLLDISLAAMPRSIAVATGSSVLMTATQYNAIDAGTGEIAGAGSVTLKGMSGATVNAADLNNTGGVHFKFAVGDTNAVIDQFDTAGSAMSLDFSAFLVNNTADMSGAATLGLFNAVTASSTAFTNPTTATIVAFRSATLANAAAIEAAFATNGGAGLMSPGSSRSINDLLGPNSRMLFAFNDGTNNTDLYYWNDEGGNRDGNVQALELLPVVSLSNVLPNALAAGHFIA